MADLLERAVSWLGLQRRSHMATAVVYSRGELEASVPATWGNTTYELDDGSGLIVEAQGTDFLVAAADLADFGEPAIGDRVETADGTIFEVLALGGEGCWRWSGPHRVTMRLHAKEVS